MENNYSRILPIPKQMLIEDLSLQDYLNYFTKDTEIGGSISDIVLYHKENSNNYLRRGGGFWSFIGKLAKKSLPFINKFILPEAINIGQSLLEKHQTKGKISKDDLSDISKDTVKRIVKKVVSGSGKRKKQKKKRLKKIRVKLIQPKIKKKNKKKKKTKKKTF